MTPEGVVRAMSHEQKAAIHPCRGEVLGDLASQEAEGWRRIQHWWANQNENFRTGLPSARGKHAERTRAIIAELDGSSPGEAKAPETEATLLAMLNYDTRGGMAGFDGNANERYGPVDDFFARRWLRAGGIPFALRTIAACPTIAVDQTLALEEPPSEHVIAADPPGWFAFEFGGLGQLHILRKLIATASADDYEAGRAEAARLRSKAEPWMRAAYTFLFPDEEAFFAADLATVIDSEYVLPEWTWALLTTRLGDLAALQRLAEGMAHDSDPKDRATPDYGFTLVHRLGTAAAPILVGYLETTPEPFSKARMGEALALLDTPVAEAFFRTVNDTILAPIANAYLER